MPRVSWFYTMNINGRGIVKVKPDIAIATLGVVTQDKVLKTAQEKNSAAAEKVINSLKETGINENDIETTGYIIDEQYDTENGKQVFRGYIVRNTIKATIKNIEDTGEIVDTAVNNGANFVNSIDFDLENPSVYYNQALIKALENAQEKAQAIERTNRIMVDKVPINITEQGYGYVPNNITASYMMKTSKASVPVSPGELQITANLTAVFAYMQM